MLLLLLSRFSRVRLCATPWTAAHQAPPSLGFSRQEHWSGLPFPSPMHESEKGKWSRSVMSDSSWPHGLQPTRFLRPWDFLGKSTGGGAIAFSILNDSGMQFLKCYLCLVLKPVLSNELGCFLFIYFLGTVYASFISVFWKLGRIHVYSHQHLIFSLWEDSKLPILSL